MKWIGQHIYDLIARFRNDVYLEDISSGTITSGGNLGLDSNNKIVKASASGGISFDGSTANGVLTYKDADEASVEANLTFLNDSNISTLSLLSNQDTGDYFSLATTTHGATTLTTVDDDATAAHFEIAADGNITLDAAGDIVLEAGGNDLTLDADNFTFTSATSQKPLVTFADTANDADGSRLIFSKNRGAAGQDADLITAMQFKSYNDAGTPELINYGQIIPKIHDASDGVESGQMIFQVQAHGGGNENGLVLTGGSQDDEVDVEIGLGSASVTKVHGTLTMGSTATINNSGVIQVAAQSVIDHDQLANYAANEHFTQANITTVGTISTGVWQGTAIATDQQKHLTWFEIAGTATGDGTNYEISVNLDNDDAPWLHNVSTGSAGTTAITVQNIMRSGGTVMPRAATVKRWTGWATTSGSSTANIALFKITPTRNNNSNVAPVLIQNTSYTALGNAKAEDWDETSFTDADLAAGDIIVSGIKCENNKTTYFTSTVEIEWD